MIRQERPSWDEYFMTLADEVATRTTCLRRAVGAIIVKEKRILATGYNGVPRGCVIALLPDACEKNSAFLRVSATKFAADCTQNRTPFFRRRVTVSTLKVLPYTSLRSPV